MRTILHEHYTGRGNYIGELPSSSGTVSRANSSRCAHGHTSKEARSLEFEMGSVAAEGPGCDMCHTKYHASPRAAPQQNSFKVFRSVLNNECGVSAAKCQQVRDSICHSRLHSYITLFPDDYFRRNGYRFVVGGFDRQLHLRAGHVGPSHDAMSCW